MKHKQNALCGTWYARSLELNKQTNNKTIQLAIGGSNWESMEKSEDRLRYGRTSKV